MNRCVSGLSGLEQKHTDLSKTPKLCGLLIYNWQGPTTIKNYTWSISRAQSFPSVHPAKNPQQTGSLNQNGGCWEFGGLTSAASHCSLAQIPGWLTSKGWWLLWSVPFAMGHRGATFHYSQWERRLPLYMKQELSTADYATQPYMNHG